jgi:hypothetical protein
MGIDKLDDTLGGDKGEDEKDVHGGKNRGRRSLLP